MKSWDTKDDNHIWDVRQTAGMVFQNPDNQLVSSIVEDDVAFGPENLGIEPQEIRKRVDQALESVNMGKYKEKGASFIIWRTEAENCDCRRCGHEARMHHL